MASFRSFLGIFGQRILKTTGGFFAGISALELPGGQRAGLRSVLPSPERMSRVCRVVSRVVLYGFHGQMPQHHPTGTRCFLLGFGKL